MINSFDNPFAKIFPVESPQELLDIAFNRAMNIAPPQMRGSDPFTKKKEHDRNRVNTAANVLADRLNRIVDQFPSIDMVHPFYIELVKVLLADDQMGNGSDRLKKALGGLYGTIATIREVERDINDRFNSAKKKAQVIDLRGEAFGRFSSIIYRAEPHLLVIQEARELLVPLPGFNPTLPTVVVAGVPNVGKSSFVRSATSGKPQIGAYPFTTKRLIFGHKKLSFLQVQFCDTPGLLDRSLENRNEIELLAIAALKHISDILLIIVDPSDTATVPVEGQLNLIAEFYEYYPTAELLIVVNKVDKLNPSEIDPLRKKILTFTESNELDIEPESLLFISSLKEDDIKEVLTRIDQLIKDKILQKSKFKKLSDPVIPNDQLPLSETLEDFNDFY